MMDTHLHAWRSQTRPADSSQAVQRIVGRKAGTRHVYVSWTGSITHRALAGSKHMHTYRRITR